MPTLRTRRSGWAVLGRGAVIGTAGGALLGLVLLTALLVVQSVVATTGLSEIVAELSSEDLIYLAYAAVIGAGVGLVAAVGSLWAWMVAVDAAPVRPGRARLTAGVVAVVVVLLIGLGARAGQGPTGAGLGALADVSAVVAGLLAYLGAPAIGYRPRSGVVADTLRR